MTSITGAYRHFKLAEKDPNVEKQLTSPGCLDCTAPQIKLAAAENAKRAAAKAVI